MFVAFCVVVLRLSFEQTKVLLRDVGHIGISDGEIGNILKKEAERLTPAYERLKKTIGKEK